MKLEKNIVEYDNTKSVSGSIEYDMRDPVQRKGGIRALLAFVLPLVVFGYLAKVFYENDQIVLVVISIFLAVFGAAYLTLTMILINKEKYNIGACSPEDIYNFKVVRAVFVTIMLCATFIPFLNYIYSIICAKRFPECGMYGKGMNMQLFTLIWSFISIFGIGLIVILYFAGFI